MGKKWNSDRFYFLGLQNYCGWWFHDCNHEIKRCLLLRKKVMANLDSVLKKHHFASKDPYTQSYGFSSSHVQVWELDHKEGWVPKNWCFWTEVLGKTFESPLDSKIKLVNPKGNQSWIFIGRLLLRLKRQYFGPLCEEPTHWKRPWCWEDERQEKKHRGRGWGWNGYHHRLSGHEFEETLGDSGGQGSLTCCSPWGCRVRLI